MATRAAVKPPIVTCVRRALRRFWDSIARRLASARAFTSASMPRSTASGLLSQGSASASSAGSRRPPSPRPRRTHSSALATRRRRVFSASTAGLDPLARRRPADDQHLVGDVHPQPSRLVGAGGQQAVGDQDVGARRRKRRGRRSGAEVVDAELAAGVGAALAELDQTQEDPPGDPLLIGRQGGEGGVGLGGHRHGQAATAVVAEGVVRGTGQQPARHRAPEQHQRLLEHRQRAGLVGRVGEQTLDQALFEVDAHRLGRLDDRLPQRLAPERRDLDDLALVDRPERRCS